MDVKSELSQVVVHSPPERRAEVSAVLRFGGGLHIANGRLVVDAELDHLGAARRLCRDIQGLFGHTPALRAVSAAAGRGQVYRVQVVGNAESLARQTGLLNQRGQPVRGMPAHVVAGQSSDLGAAWRGAFLARGALVDNGRTGGIEVNCPGPEAALALVGAARRLGVTARMRDLRGADRVVVRDPVGVSTVLHCMGATDTAQAWTQRRKKPVNHLPAEQASNLDDANRRRSLVAGAATAARVSRALEILGACAPEHLAHAGRLRIDNPSASLEELAQIAVPPMSKDALAGRLRRLISTADRAAAKAGIADTSATSAAASDRSADHLTRRLG
ncbi:DNA-binding protein WhiA (plasmid) [Mycobacterium avium subsp. hominissuis]|uniref:DNA-binding protein WhiA n=1 Tax=Mycobacterium avium TaxID=1764 RepID=UPI00314069D5